MRAALRKMGNSQGVIIPKTLINQFGFEGEVEMRVTATSIVIEKPEKPPRKGWADAYKTLADEEPDHEWLDFGGDVDDEAWTW